MLNYLKIFVIGLSMMFSMSFLGCKKHNEQINAGETGKQTESKHQRPSTICNYSSDVIDKEFFMR